jgi:hypothetical protein
MTTPKKPGSKKTTSGKQTPSTIRPPAAAITPTFGKPVATGKPPSGKKPSGKKPAPASPAIQQTRGEYVHFSDKITGALKNIGDVIEDNRGTLDSIQDMAVQLTRTIISLRAVVMRYVEAADNVLEKIVPIMENLPIIPDKVMDFARDARMWAQKISDASDLVEKVLPGVERSLTTADISGLQASAGEVANLTRALQEMIPIDGEK